jgi:hypothetical protein
MQIRFARLGSDGQLGHSDLRKDRAETNDRTRDRPSRKRRRSSDRSSGSGGTGKTQEEARGASRTHFPWIVRRKTEAFGPTEPRRESIGTCSDADPAGCAERQRCLVGQAVREPEEGLRAFGRNPRDRPGPKGLGRNLFRDEPKPSPARDSDPVEVGPGSNAGPHCFWGFGDNGPRPEMRRSA